MKRFFVMALVALVVAAGAILATLATHAAEPEFIESGNRLGKVRLYPATGAPTGIVMLFSDRGGWASSDDTLARALAADGRAVYGIDTASYVRALEAAPEGCVLLNWEMETFARQVEKTLPFTEFQQPFLMGTGVGATLVFAAIGQAMPNTFDAGIGFGFRPVLDIKKSLCLSAAAAEPDQVGVRYKPYRGKETPYLFTADKQFSSELQRHFLDKMPDAQLLDTKLGNTASLAKEAFRLTAIYDAQANPLGDIPIVEIPPKDGSKGPHVLAIIYSGDGGWRDIDKQIGGYLSDHGFYVLGIDTLRYLWREKPAEQVAADLDRIVQHYASVWTGKGIVLAGYSFGADIVPFLVNRVAPATRKNIKLISLLGFSPMADFEIHVTGWLGMQSGHGMPTLPEVTKIRDIPIQCVYGLDEDETLCPKPELNFVERVAMQGGHHFGGDYRQIADHLIRSAMKAGAK